MRKVIIGLSFVLSILFFNVLQVNAMSAEEYRTLANDKVKEYLEGTYTIHYEEKIKSEDLENLKEKSNFAYNLSTTLIDTLDLGGLEEIKEQKTSNLLDIDGVYTTNIANRPLILDMDLSSDVDDLCALGLACTMDNLGLFDLKGVMYSIYNEYDSNISALNGFLHTCGLNDVLVGKCECLDAVETSRYWGSMNGSGDTRTNVDTATRQYRKILANSNEKVDIVTTGYLENLMYLLRSQADDISDKSGMELVQEKVGQLYVVGGAYPNGIDNNFIIFADSMVGADYVSRNWPKPIVYLTSNVGGGMTVGGKLIKSGSKNMVARGLLAWGTDYGRAAWDPFGVYVCAFSGKEEISQLKFIRTDITINSLNGVNTFIDSEQGRHYRVELALTDKNYYETLMESFLFYIP